MKEVDQVNSIICLVNREGKSYAEVAKLLDIDSRTVKKYADLNDHSIPIQIRVKPSPVMDPVKPIIDEWLEADLKVPKKQRHTAKRIYERLRDEYGFTGSERSVRKYVSQKKRELYVGVPHEYLPLVALLGEAEFDFGEVVISYKGQEIKAQEAVLSYPHSNGGFSQLFLSNNQECVLEALKRFFHFIGGVPRKIRFDNLSPVVYLDKDGNKVVTEGVQRFANHYGFQCVFCNKGKGHEKGNVENKVGYTRRNWYTPVPVLNDLDELEAFNKTLFDKAIKDMDRKHYVKDRPIRELWEEDLKYCHVLPPVEYDCYRLEQFKTDKRGLIRFENNLYSTVPGMVEQKVWIKVYHDHIEVLDSCYQMLCQHERVYGNNFRLVDWSIYLQSLRKKPRAIYNTDFYQALPEQWQIYLQNAIDLDKVLAYLQSLMKSSKVQYASGLRVLLENHDDTLINSIMAMPVTLPPYSPDFSAYNRLLTAGGETA